MRLLARSMPFICVFISAGLIAMLGARVVWPAVICGVWIANLFAPWHKDAV